MSRSFDLVDWKVAEADFFLQRISKCGTDFFAACCYVSAFVSSARSITYALQSCLRDIKGFSEWYELHKSRLRNDPIAKFFHEFRRVNQHIGETSVNGASVRPGKKCRYRFTETHDIPHVPQEDVEIACRQYMKLLVSLVYNCYQDFGPFIDPKQHYTAEFYKKLGKTIDDADEELFGIRGWTEAPGYPEEYRWQALRDSLPGCSINHIFRKYLMKIVPEPKRLPDLKPRINKKLFDKYIQKA